MGAPESFFYPEGPEGPEGPERPEGATFRATELTRGPWSADSAHGGPPAALLARAFERRLAGLDGGLGAAPSAATPAEIVRLTVEFLRPVPIATLTVKTAVLRAGRQVRALAGWLHAGNTEVCHATALCIRGTSIELPPVPPRPRPAPPPGPDESPEFRFPFFSAAAGYHTGMDLRMARGPFGQGAAAVWMRMRHPLVPGELPSPVQRTAIAADSGNGVSLLLDVERFLFVNPDLTIYLHRPPAGEWIGLDATTTAEPSGVGLAESALYDERGPIGRSLQSLVVAQRER